MWDLGFPTRDQTQVLCIERQIPHHWTTRKVPSFLFFWLHLFSFPLISFLAYSCLDILIPINFSSKRVFFFLNDYNVSWWTIYLFPFPVALWVYEEKTVTSFHPPVQHIVGPQKYLLMEGTCSKECVGVNLVLWLWTQCFRQRKLYKPDILWVFFFLFLI